jgi:sulfur carrier protein
MTASATMNLLVNGQPRSVLPRITIRRLLEELELPIRGIAVEVNQQIVPRQRHAEHELAEGDRLEIVSLVGGG